MAGELFASTTTGQTVYALLYNGTGQVWNGSAFVTPAAGGWSGYAISMPEVGGTGRYVGDMPSVPNGIYYYEACRQAGGTPASTDTVEYTGTLPWDGTVIADVQTILARLPGALVGGRMDASVGAIAAGPLADVTDAAAAGVLDAAQASHNTEGSIGAAIGAAAEGGGGGADAAALWTYPERTLTQSAAQVQAAVSGSDIAILRGDTVTVALTGLGSIAARTRLWFGLKEHLADADSEAVALVEESAGLTVLCGAAYATTAHGSITVNDAAAGNITITLAAAATAQMTPRHGLDYDVQMLTASGVRTLTAGRASVVADVTRALS